MAKPTIVTRAGKGSALTWTEGDSNLTNLQNATVTLKAGSGGTDVVSDLNGTVTLVAGSNITLAGDNTAKTVTITASAGASALSSLTDVTVTTPSTGQVLQYSAVSSKWTNQTLTYGSVTNVSGTGTVNGLTLTGSVSTSGNLTLGGTLDLSSPPAIGGSTPAAGTFTTLTPTTAALKDIRETVYNIGNSSTSTLTPDAANGSVQTITATGNFTMSAFANPVSGQTITFIITQDGTGSRTLTSTMKFAGGYKTLSTAASSIDILTVSYIGTTYYASLAKGFA